MIIVEIQICGSRRVGFLRLQAKITTPWYLPEPGKEFVSLWRQKYFGLEGYPGSE